MAWPTRSRTVTVMRHLLQLRPGPDRRDVRAMSLIELVVVIVFTSMLIAAVASYLQGNFTRAGDHAPRTSVSLVSQYQADLYAARRTFTDDPAVLDAVDGQFSYVEGAATSSGPRSVSVAVSDTPRQAVGMAAAAPSGRCWMTALVASGADRGGRYGTVAPGGSTPCTGQAALELVDDPDADAGTSWETRRELG